MLKYLQGIGNMYAGGMSKAFSKLSLLKTRFYVE